MHTSVPFRFARYRAFHQCPPKWLGVNRHMRLTSPGSALPSNVEMTEQRRLWSVSESCGKKDVSLNGLQITECASAAWRRPAPRYERVARVGSSRMAGISPGEKFPIGRRLKKI